MQRDAAHSVRTIPAVQKRRPDRTGETTDAGRTGDADGIGTIHPPASDQTFPGNQFLSVGLQFGRPGQNELVEPFQTPHRQRTRAARLDTDGPFGRRHENLPKRQRLPGRFDGISGRHFGQKSESHLPRPARRTVPDRQHPIRFPGPVAAIDHFQRHDFDVAAYGRHFRCEYAGRRTGTDHFIPEKPGILQLLDQQHQLCSRLDGGQPHGQPDDGRKTLHGRIYRRRRSDARRQPNLPHPEHLYLSGLQPLGSRVGFSLRKPARHARLQRPENRLRHPVESAGGDPAPNDQSLPELPV